MQTTAPTNATEAASPEASTQGGVDLASTLAQLGVPPETIAATLAATMPAINAVPPPVNPTMPTSPVALPPAGLVIPALNPSSNELQRFKWENLNAKATALTKGFLLESTSLSALRGASVDPAQQAVIDNQIATLGDQYRQKHQQITDAISGGEATPRTARKSLGELTDKAIGATASGKKLVASTRGEGTLRFTDEVVASQQYAEMLAKVTAGTHQWSLTKNGLNVVQMPKARVKKVGIAEARWRASMTAQGMTPAQIDAVVLGAKK